MGVSVHQDMYISDSETLCVHGCAMVYMCVIKRVQLCQPRMSTVAYGSIREHVQEKLAAVSSSVCRTFSVCVHMPL
jgi:hypothetical protein